VQRYSEERLSRFAGAGFVGGGCQSLRSRQGAGRPLSTKTRERLELALAKATTAIARMIAAYSEQLVTIDELRTLMPELRARETGLHQQIDAVDSQLADRELYLKLAEDLEGFLTQLRANTRTAHVEERQHVLRLLVKDVLIGPDKITIRHRIPIRERAADHGKPSIHSDTEGDLRTDCPLRGGVLSPLLANIACPSLTNTSPRRRAGRGPRRSNGGPDVRKVCRTTGSSGMRTTLSFCCRGPGRRPRRCFRK
jgi:hypothetical protein